MKAKFAKGGAITSALAYAFCWQLPLVLASFGLGSITMSVWLAKYRWLFFAATLVFLCVAFYYTYRDRNKVGPWNMRFLWGTTALSMVFIVYSFIAN